METKITPIDINSVEEKREAGILWYNPPFERDPSVWTKTPKEKAAWKKARPLMRAYKFLS